MNKMTPEDRERWRTAGKHGCAILKGKGNRYVLTLDKAGATVLAPLESLREPTT